MRMLCLLPGLGLILGAIVLPVQAQSADTDGDGFSVAQGDCNDKNSDIHPGAPETCNKVDDNCNGSVDEDADCGTSGDADGDGFSVPGDCDDSNATIHPYALELCDGMDNDCDGSIDEGNALFPDVDVDSWGASDSQEVFPCLAEVPAGYSRMSSDCNDDDPETYPGATEICDGKDNNCDGAIDEGVKTIWYPDVDGDGVGTNVGYVKGCTAPTGSYVVITEGYKADCDDTNAAIYPGATEICDGIDNDCDGVVDEDGICDPVLTPTPTPDPTPTSTPESTATPDPTPTSTPEATTTPEPVTPTPDEGVTSTPDPTPTPGPSVTPAPTDEPVGGTSTPEPTPGVSQTPTPEHVAPDSDPIFGCSTSGTAPAHSGGMLATILVACIVLVSRRARANKTSKS